MGNFNRGGNGGGGRSFGGGRDNRGGGRPEFRGGDRDRDNIMHKTKCSDCGKE